MPNSDLAFPVALAPTELASALTRLVVSGDTIDARGPSSMSSRPQPSRSVVHALRRTIGGFAPSPVPAALRALFGISRATVHEPVQLRRAEAARRLGIRVSDTLPPTCERALVTSLADGLYTSEFSRYWSGCSPAASPPVGAAWATRHGVHRQIADPLSRLRAELVGLTQGPVLVGRLPHGRNSSLHASLWYLLQFRWSVHQVYTTLGGQWLLTSADADLDASLSASRVLGHAGLSETQLVIVAGGLRAGNDASFADFLHNVDRPDRRAVIGAWRDWLLSCSCADNETHSKSCAVHACIDRADSLLAVLDADAREFVSARDERHPHRDVLIC